MNFLDKVYIKIGYKLIASKISIGVIIGVYLVSKKHIYIDKESINYNKIFNLLKAFDSVSITGTGVLIVFYNEFIIKYPLGSHSKEALEDEFVNYKKLKDSNLSNLVYYSLLKKENYYVMDKLNRCNYPIDAHTKICKMLEKNKYSFFKVQDFFEEEIFKNAVNYIKDKDELKIVIKFIQAMDNIKSCAMHGDLTQYNIMLTKNNKLVFIDLDRFTFHGIDKIDRLHFVIEFYAKKSNKNFFEILEMILIRKKMSKEYFNYLFLYFIYRIGVEYDEEIQLPSSYSDNVNKLLKIFLKKGNICTF